MKNLYLSLLTGAAVGGIAGCADAKQPQKNEKPNIIIIYADDLGYGDVVANGAHRVRTPNVDRLAAEGIRFTDMHASSATSTPSRFCLLTGQYPWRVKGTGIAPGNAGMIVTPRMQTMPAMLRRAGYSTAAVGKWHLGLGAKTGEQDWNGEITPGLSDIGFDYSFIMAATGDRVPCVYIENGRVVGLDPDDPIEVSYREPFPGEPTGKNNPELLTKLRPSHGHDQAVVNGISRIGYMRGGKSALWVDEEIADRITEKAVEFIRESSGSDDPFFLYFATNDIHVPRFPHPRFVGATEMGPRGDAIAQFDWSVGQILETLDELGIAGNTLVILSSDNGPVVDDGYEDRAVELLGGHKPSGPFRGGKYSSFEAGTRVPGFARWPGVIEPGAESAAAMSHVDLFAIFADLAGQELGPDEAPDSRPHTEALLGRDPKGREYVIEHAGSLSVIKDGWKYIEPNNGRAFSPLTATETGNNPEPQLYDLTEDIGERDNLAPEHPGRIEELKALLDAERNKTTEKQ